MGDPGFAIWLTGLPAAGKSTLARGLRQAFLRRGISCVVLDSDDIRAVLTPEPAYTPEERDWFYHAIGYLTVWLARSGVNVLVAATANRRHYRQYVRDRLERFAEVYVHCPLEVARQRDPKDIYAQAAAGQAQHVPGVDAPYEFPLAPEAQVNTVDLEADEAVAALLAQLDEFVVG
ncbi:MAG: adenylyl-sulfate kinase [Candidatus Promineifilaceae bacterium]|nr:adenylyl-sulfate kinase [Candidatus Promineifilaceae bacterium]